MEGHWPGHLVLNLKVLRAIIVPIIPDFWHCYHGQRNHFDLLAPPLKCICYGWMSQTLPHLNFETCFFVYNEWGRSQIYQIIKHAKSYLKTRNHTQYIRHNTYMDKHLHQNMSNIHNATIFGTCGSNLVSCQYLP